MNVLLTGSEGFVGRLLGESLKHAGHTVVSTDVRADREGCHRLDLAHPAGVPGWLAGREDESDVDAIVHLAGRVATRETAREMSLFTDNLRIAEGLILLAQALRPERVVDFSSMAVYPATDGVFTEESATGTGGNRDGLYGLAKLCAENLFDFFLGQAGVATTHMRVAQIYGAGMRNDRIIPLFIKQLAESNELTVGGGGERVSAFIHVDDLVEITRFFVENEHPGVFNVGTNNISFGELARAVVEELGDDDSAILTTEDGPRERFTLDTSKLRALLAESGAGLLELPDDELLRRRLHDEALISQARESSRHEAETKGRP